MKKELYITSYLLFFGSAIISILSFHKKISNNTSQFCQDGYFSINRKFSDYQLKKDRNFIKNFTFGQQDKELFDIISEYNRYEFKKGLSGIDERLTKKYKKVERKVLEYIQKNGYERFLKLTVYLAFRFQSLFEKYIAITDSEDPLQFGMTHPTNSLFIEVVNYSGNFIHHAVRSKLLSKPLKKHEKDFLVYLLFKIRFLLWGKKIRDVKFAISRFEYITFLKWKIYNNLNLPPTTVNNLIEEIKHQLMESGVGPNIKIYYQTACLYFKNQRLHEALFFLKKYLINNKTDKKALLFFKYLKELINP